jgi:hypothetical protein
MVPCSTPVAATGQGRSVSLAKRKVLQGSSSVVKACMPWMAAQRKEKWDETAVCGLRGLETERGDAGLAKCGRDGQWRPWTALSYVRRRRTIQDYGQRYTRGVAGGLAWAFSAL